MMISPVIDLTVYMKTFKLSVEKLAKEANEMVKMVDYCLCFKSTLSVFLGQV